MNSFLTNHDSTALTAQIVKHVLNYYFVMHSTVTKRIVGRLFNITR